MVNERWAERRVYATYVAAERACQAPSGTTTGPLMRCSASRCPRRPRRNVKRIDPPVGELPEGMGGRPQVDPASPCG